MKNDQLYDAVTDIREDFVEDAGRYKLKTKIYRPWWTAAAAVALIVVLIVGMLAVPDGKNGGSVVHAVAEAEYPEMHPYPNERDFIGLNGEFDDVGFSEVYDPWRADLMAQHRPSGYASGLEQYFETSTREFLSGAGKNNRVFSPVNVYLALGMLAEMTDGNSRQQILQVLGSENIDHIRQQAADIWNACYRQDGAVTSVLANSLWLNQDMVFQQTVLDNLAKQYYASSYRGEMGSKGMNRAIRDWIDVQTGGLLRDHSSGGQLDRNTILALASTVFFRARWSSEFRPQNTDSGIFHGAAGDTTCQFMHQNDIDTYYWADKFGAIAKRLENGGNMWFLLPDEGISPEELVRDGQMMEFILQNGKWENQKMLIVNAVVPKFDAASTLELGEGLKAIGITDIFESERSDFSPLIDTADGIFVSQAQHDVRVQIDEEGCTAAAYTIMETAGAVRPPEEKMEFVLNRPFVFAITNEDGIPLFTGIINQIN